MWASAHIQLKPKPIIQPKRLIKRVHYVIPKLNKIVMKSKLILSD